MKIKTIIMALMFVVNCNASVTWQQTLEIYNKLIKVNKLKPAKKFVITNKNVLNAWGGTDGIVITKLDLQYFNKDMMAGLLGHELAHVQFSDDIRPLPGKIQENRADEFAKLWGTKAGFDKCKMAQRYLLYLKKYGNNGGFDDPHSPNTARYRKMCD